MGIVIVAALGVVILYCWLAGNWFARLLAFAILSVVLGFAAVLFVVGNRGDFQNYVGIGCAIIVAWWISGFPIYYQRHKTELFAEFSKPLPNGWHIVPSWRRAPGAQAPLFDKYGRRQ